MLGQRRRRWADVVQMFCLLVSPPCCFQGLYKGWNFTTIIWKVLDNLDIWQHYLAIILHSFNVLEFEKGPQKNVLVVLEQLVEDAILCKY